MRKSYIEKELLLELEERNEQLQAEKERLMYDNALQRRGRPIEEDDDRSAISRGLLAGPASVGIGDTSLGPAAIPVDAGSSKAAPPRPSDPPPAGPPSLPPGPPSSKCSSTSGESIVSIYPTSPQRHPSPRNSTTQRWPQGRSSRVVWCHASTVQGRKATGNPRRHPPTGAIPPLALHPSPGRTQTSSTTQRPHGPASSRV